MLIPHRKAVISLLSAAIVLSPLAAVPSVFAESGTQQATGTTQTAVGAADEVVVFPDVNLEKAVRIALNKPVDPITQADMLQLTQLSSYNRPPEVFKQIENLSGLEYALNLEVLDFFSTGEEGKGIKDLSPLRNLTKLTKIQLMDQQVEDLSPLAQLTNLEDLNLYASNVSDISPLANLSKLKRINFGNNKLADISSMRNFQIHNTTLHLGGNEITDLSPIVDLAQRKNWTYSLIDLAFNNIRLEDQANIDLMQTLQNRGVELFVNPQQGKLVGQLVDSERKPLPNVKLTLQGEIKRDGDSTLHVTASTVSNRYGEYSFDESLLEGLATPLAFVPSGRYKITLEAPGQPITEGEINVAGGINSRIDLMMTPEGDWDNLPRTATSVALDKYRPTDIEGHWAKATLEDAIRADIVNGYSEQDGTVTIRPNNQITRAEFVALVVKALNLQTDKQGKSFADVPEGIWYHDYVRIASSLGIVNGVNEREFAPYRPIQRDEIVTLLVRAFSASIAFGETKQFSDVPDYWAKSYIVQAAGAGLVNGYTDGTFRPLSQATRAEAILMAMRAMQLEKSNLPDDAMLTDIARRNETEGLAELNAGNFDGAFESNKRYTTGYMKAIFDNSVASVKNSSLLGFSFQENLLGTLGFKVISKSDRLATVEMTGAVYESIYTRDEEVNKKTNDTSGVLYLKKSADGIWRIYDYSYISER